MNVKDENDGVFFISEDDYLRYYRSTTICKADNGFDYKSLEVENKGSSGYELFKISISKKSKTFFTVT